MTELEKLTVPLSELDARLVRLGYALGYRHAEQDREPDIPGGTGEFAVLDALELG